ncbi:acyl-CoA dehydrogenase family protein [Aestuariivita sp.]|jgi:alkylation response protein AidB-like acyl-CoA dehydrogenase|uniref:acyl-CoA dehydrogenase family protein n=1 Tax=Aestuariivita sp. TaxID=1872407 RepID=UPI00216BBF08|nr:acyl-CoA dehydrogenase family protein [Aestuariivita sp.]MCE8009539.1 acyl-CoA/acyl-ACP dehydrogenase [Aestuariivita sp.]
MDFNFTQEQSMFRDAVKGWAQRALADDALERARNPEFPFDVARQACEAGLLGITIPQEDGGLGGKLMDAVIAIEQVALVCPKSADVIQAGSFGAIRTFSEYATPDQKQRYLTRLLRGEAVIGLGMTEAEAGSAVTDLKTFARPDPSGDGWLLKGGKVFTSHSEEADVFLIYCRFGEGVGQIGSVIIERGAPGFTMGKSATYLNGEHWCPLFFDDVPVPQANVLLGPGGFKKQITGFNAERLGNSARALALGRHAFNIARNYAAERKQFGRTLSDFQGLQWKFADMYAQLEAAQLLLYRAAISADQGLPDAQQTAVAKLMCNEAGFRVSNEAMQVMGGLGYCGESLVEYCFRKTRGWQIAGGSLEMMRNRIAEGVFDTRFSQRAPQVGGAG